MIEAANSDDAGENPFDILCKTFIDEDTPEDEKPADTNLVDPCDDEDPAIYIGSTKNNEFKGSLIDSGAQKSVIGLYQARAYFRRIGRKFEVTPCPDKF